MTNDRPQWMKDADNEIAPHVSNQTLVFVRQIIARCYSTEAERVQELERVLQAAMTQERIEVPSPSDSPQWFRDAEKAMGAWEK